MGTGDETKEYGPHDDLKWFESPEFDLVDFIAALPAWLSFFFPYYMPRV